MQLEINHINTIHMSCYEMKHQCQKICTRTVMKQDMHLGTLLSISQNIPYSELINFNLTQSE
jgi:hypothetical protein